MTKNLKKLLAIFMILSLMMGLCACSFFDSITSRIDSESVSISSPEVIRLLITAINDENELADSFSAIPEVQRKGVTYSQYYEYITLLRQFSTSGRKITGFRFLNQEDNSRHLDSIYNRMSNNVEIEDYYTVFQPYGDIKTVVLEYSKEQTTPVYMYVSVDSNGIAYLSSAIISSTIATYNYIQQYFKLLTEENADGISSIISIENNVPDNYVDDIYKARSEYIIDYYKYRVRTDPNQFVLLTANPFFVEYRVPEILSADGNDITDSVIYAFKTANEIKVIDSIAQDTSIDLLTVYVTETQYLRCGLNYDFSAVTRICGKPVQSTLKDGRVGTIFNKEGKLVDKRLVVLTYNGMNLSFEVAYENENSWYGELVSIRLYENSKASYSVCGISVGDDEISIMQKFPMISYGEYTLDYLMNSKVYSLNYEIEDSKIDYITIQKNK